MKGNEWLDCCEQIKHASHKLPQLKSFFRLTFSLFFLFPYLITSLLTKKQKFVDQIAQKSKFWEIRWIKQYFGFQINTPMINYLLQEDWWWHLLNQMDSENNPIELYTLSNLHESLKKSKQRKISGIFFTPKNQIQIICHYALFFFLRNRNDLSIDDETLYQIIFQYKYPSNLQKEEYNRIARLITTVKVLDPSCGSGIFLAEMGNLLHSLILANPIYAKISKENEIKIIRRIFSNLYGYDIDSNSIELAKIILTQQFLQITQIKTHSENELTNFINKQLQIHKNDFISENNFSHQKFDLIIGNPPYIRHHGLNTTSLKESSSKEKFVHRFRSVFPKILFKWDKKADLYVYFWVKAITQVFEKGVIAFVLSRAWLSSRYTTPLKQVFLSFFHLDLVIELPFEVWESAEVRTHIVVGHKDIKNTKQRSMGMIVWKNSIESLLEFEKQKFITDLETSILENDNLQLEIKTKETDSYRFTLISDLTPLLMNSKKIVPFLRLDYLAMSSFLVKLLIAKRNHFCLLKELGKLEMGSTTGANRFFYLKKDTIEKYRIPKENLFLMTKSPKEWQSIFAPTRSKLKFFLHIPNKLSEDSSRELCNYVSNIQNEILRRPYFKNKTADNWYQVPLIQPDIILPNMTFKRSFVAYNRNKLHIDKQWIGFWVNNQRWLSCLLGFLNSTLGVLLREIQGTRTLGLGSLKLSLQECQNLLVLDPRKIPEGFIARFNSLINALGELNIDSVYKEQNSHSGYSKIQELLDHLILIECLGMTPTDVTRIREILKFEIDWRFAKEKRGNHN